MHIRIRRGGVDQVICVVQLTPAHLEEIRMSPTYKNVVQLHSSVLLTSLLKSQLLSSTLKNASLGVNLVGTQLPRRNNEVSACDLPSIQTSVMRSALQSSFISAGDRIIFRLMDFL